MARSVHLDGVQMRLYFFGFLGPLGLDSERFATPFLKAYPRISRRKQIIRTHLRLRRFGSDYIGLVRVTGVEPARLSAREPKSRMSANSIIPAVMSGGTRRPLFHPLFLHGEGPEAGRKAESAYPPQLLPGGMEPGRGAKPYPHFGTGKPVHAGGKMPR